MKRITEKHLENKVALLNKLIGEDYYSLDHAYSGVRLEGSKGSCDVLGTGYITKRELWTLMDAYYRGIEKGMELNN